MSAPVERPSPAASMTADALADELELDADERQLATGLLRLGVTAEQIREASARGQLEGAVFEGVLDPERHRRTVSAAQIEADGGLSVSDIQATLRSFGLPPPDSNEGYFTPERRRRFVS